MKKKVTLRKDFLKLLSWTPETKGFLQTVSAIHYPKSDYQRGDEDCPFFSEAYLYNLLGKEDARTLLSLLSKIANDVGLDLNSMMDYEV